MATATGTKNADRHSSSSSQVESDDDDPYIRGLFLTRKNNKSTNSLSNANVTINHIDAALIVQTHTHLPSVALKLDQYVLGKTGVATDVARGSLCKYGSAISSLKDVASMNKQNLSVPVSELVGSPGALTWSSSSSSEEDNNDIPKQVEPDIPMGASCADEIYGLPIKRMIKQVCIAGLKHGGKHRKAFCLSLNEIQDICKISQVTFLQEPSLLRLKGNIKVIGDLHGQFRDLMRIFKRVGMPPNQNYLFLGDYVDRGKQSLETIMLLLLLKLRYPNNIHMLRGNHESAGITKVYGFYDECKRRSSVKAWRYLVDVFNTLPVAAIVNERIFCVHGGLSPSLSSFSQIEAIQRPTDIPDTGLLCDLLWSDPDPQVKEWSENDRGVSYCFGARSLERFCKKLKIDLVVRGHMVVEDGYEFFDGKRLVTVFSAPNYCGDFDNNGAIMNINSNLLCSFEVIEPASKVENKSESPEYNNSNPQKSQKGISA